MLSLDAFKGEKASLQIVLGVLVDTYLADEMVTSHKSKIIKWAKRDRRYGWSDFERYGNLLYKFLRIFKKQI